MSNDSAINTKIANVIESPENIIHLGNPLDLPTEIFNQGLERRKTNRQALVNWIRESLVKGVDFGTIQFWNSKNRRLEESKPFLMKSGAEKVIGMLGITAHFPNLSQYEIAAIQGVEIKNVIVRCELRTSNGRLVAEGSGSRVQEQDLVPERRDKQGSVRPTYHDLNKALKMAEKSAFINATLRCAGMSEMFTQDLEDMAHLQDVPEVDEPKKEPSIDQQQLAQITERLTKLDSKTQQKVRDWLVSIGCSTNLTEMTTQCWEALNRKLDLTEQTKTQASTISNPQKARLEAMISGVAKRRGITAKELREQVKEWCKTQWGIEHFIELNTRQYQELCDVQLPRFGEVEHAP